MENFTARERRDRAIEAATEIAAAYRITSDSPVVLKDSNNTVIHLAPLPVVAKVATSSLRKQTGSDLAHELNVALHLIDRGAPIVEPSAEIPPAVYRYKDFELTFWQHCAGEIKEEIDCPELVTAVEQFHAAFADYQGELKPFTEKYEECYSLLSSDLLSPELPAADRRFLRQVYENLNAKLQTFDYECVPAHEEIHSGNVLWKGSKPLLIDFESCCLAPREIDFLAFSETNLSGLLPLDKELMDILGVFKGFCVAVWCWTDPNRAPEVREAADYHLSCLRAFSLK